jgi:hypothetical protein
MNVDLRFGETYRFPFTVEVSVNVGDALFRIVYVVLPVIRC